MKARKFPNLERLVKNNGGEDAQNELRELLALAATNFAACTDVETACVAVSDRVSVITGGGQLIGDVCRWLYARCEERCTCNAPSFITGCDNAVSNGCHYEMDECLCTTGECPWIHHTGIFK